GDSSVYRLRQGIIRKLTKDDSYVQKLVEDGTITKEEAKNHPKKNMLVKALGCETDLEVNVFYKKFLPEDVILICSDGLTNMISEEQIYNIINNDINQAAENLIKEANLNGGLDNITFIIIKN
ncbi:MAG: serine/threonine-protein phosphatase, partial [Clostridia bacterium]